MEKVWQVYKKYAILFLFLEVGAKKQTIKTRDIQCLEWQKVYHVILRGNAKQDIFLDQQDFSKFMKEICRTIESYLYEL